MLHELRRRRTPPQRRRRWLALGIVLALHVLFALLTWHEMQMREQSVVSGRRSDALQVRWIPRPPVASPVAQPAEVPPPPLPPQAVAIKQPPLHHEPPAKNAMTVNMPSTPTEPTSPVLAASGQPLPASASSAPAVAEPGYVQHVPQGDPRVMQHSSPVTYQATRFEKDWAPVRGNSSLDDALQHAVDKTTVTHTFHVAPGVRVRCKVVVAALAGGCGIGDPPRQPSGKSEDMRLNMAPANPLVSGTATPTPPSLEECIAIYRASKPLPQGCPMDTPTRSVDAELRERATPQSNSP